MSRSPATRRPVSFPLRTTRTAPLIEANAEIQAEVVRAPLVIRQVSSGRPAAGRIVAVDHSAAD